MFVSPSVPYETHGRNFAVAKVKQIIEVGWVSKTQCRCHISFIFIFLLRAICARNPKEIFEKVGKVSRLW